MVKRRERRVGGCEKSIVQGMYMVEARNGGSAERLSLVSQKP